MTVLGNSPWEPYRHLAQNQSGGGSSLAGAGGASGVQGKTYYPVNPLGPFSGPRASDYPSGTATPMTTMPGTSPAPVIPTPVTPAPVTPTTPPVTGAPGQRPGWLGQMGQWRDFTNQLRTAPDRAARHQLVQDWRANRQQRMAQLLGQG